MNKKVNVNNYNSCSITARYPIYCDGKSGYEWEEASKIDIDNALTVIANIKFEDKMPERIQTIISKWQINETFKEFEAFDVGRTEGLDTAGFLGAIFDGRYIYFVPRISRTKFLRYDTKKPFKSPESWSAFDLGFDIPYQGCGYDGRYIYFAPGGNNNPVLRYDTKKPFDDKKSYETFEISTLPGLESTN